MCLTKAMFAIFFMLICLSENSQAEQGALIDTQSDPSLVQPTNETPPDAQNHLAVPQDAPQEKSQGQAPLQGQDGQIPYPTQPQVDSAQQNQPDPNLVQGQQGQTRMEGQGQLPAQGQAPAQPQNTQGQAENQDQLPADPARGQPLPKKPKVLPRPNPDPAPSPTFSPAPAPPVLPEPTARSQPSGPKTLEQRAYESAMQNRWKTAADDIALLRTQGEALQGKKGKAFRESLRTASGNRSMARTKLNQLIRGSSTDFDKHKIGVERAFADLDTSIERVRSYFNEQPSP